MRCKNSAPTVGGARYAILIYLFITISLPYSRDNIFKDWESTYPLFTEVDLQTLILYSIP